MLNTIRVRCVLLWSHTANHKATHANGFVRSEKNERNGFELFALIHSIDWFLVVYASHLPGAKKLMNLNSLNTAKNNMECRKFAENKLQYLDLVFAVISCRTKSNFNYSKCLDSIDWEMCLYEKLKLSPDGHRSKHSQPRNQILLFFSLTNLQVSIAHLRYGTNGMNASRPLYDWQTHPTYGIDRAIIDNQMTNISHTIQMS